MILTNKQYRFILFFFVFLPMTHKTHGVSHNQHFFHPSKDLSWGRDSFKQKKTINAYQQEAYFCRAKYFYMKRRYSESLGIFLSFIEQHSRHKHLDEAYYCAALCYRALGNIDSASLCLDRLIYQKAIPLYKKLALLDQLNIFYDQERFTEALYLCERLVFQFSPNQLPESFLVCFANILRISHLQKRGSALNKKLCPRLRVIFEKTLFKHKRKNFSNKKQYYALQMGSFRKMTNANRLKKNLRRKGLESYVVKEKNRNKLLYKVRLKSSPSLQKIQKCRQKLLHLKNLHSTIVSYTE